MVGDVPVLLIMKKPIVVSGDVSVYDVAKIMIKENVPCVLVVCGKPNHESIEVATDEDMINKVLIKKLPPDKIKVEDIASDKLVTIPPDTTIDEALKIMNKYKTKELFIVDEGKIVGVITQDDITKVTPEIISTLKELVNYLLKIIDEVINENENNESSEIQKTDSNDDDKKENNKENNNKLKLKKRI
ncbi:inosine monophosphate dehydrogenase [Methanocaldococcus bathoardescens]|uniref:Inosine monophosphate dehydrogenase n=1 Tax=Methanocaldococcus bathoardescens TaxID=1301915 RepID=A0A076LKN9_9EURY|nr:CBS domain-containing protein [Methanocaldococcus bathoardescens]AIJ06204.1 inosine monophosphate dehydrogenase [Methanocaldococcus bathoardescens]